MSGEKKMPTADDFLQALENENKTEFAKQIRQGLLTSKLINSLLNVSIPEDMQETFTVCRKPAISQCIVYDTIDNINTKNEN